jgi:WD repeat-containing protein 81
VAGWDTPISGGVTDPSVAVVSAVGCSGSMAASSGSSGWLAAGSGGGRLVLLDARAGLVVASWRGHAQRVAQLQALGGCRGDTHLLTASADGSMKLWDARMLRPAATAHPGLYGRASGWGGSDAAAPLSVYRGARDAIEGFALYQDAAIVLGGASLGLAPLDLDGSTSRQQQQQQQQQQQSRQQRQQQPGVQVIRMTGVRGVGARGSAVREGAQAGIVGLGLLPHSKLLVVGTEDGTLKVCR